MKNKFLLPLILLLSGCTTGFFNMANIEVFIVEELKTPTFSKASGTHCPFYLDVKAEDGEEIYYEIRDKAVERNAIEKRYSEKLFIDKTCYVSVYSKKDNKVSKVGTMNYIIFNITLDTPDVNYKSGVYDPFIFEFITKDTSGDIIYRRSDRNVTIYDDLTEIYSTPFNLENSCIISAYRKSGNSISPIVNYEYIIGEKMTDVPKPSYPSGNYSPFFLSFDNSEKVYYTSGAEFCTEYNMIRDEYTAPLLIKESVKISVFIKKGLSVSEIMYLSYIIDKDNSNTDIIMSKPTGNHNPFDLLIGTGIAGGKIYYTVGSEAKTEYNQIVTQYTNPIVITSTSVVSVYVKNGDKNTNIQSFTYTIFERTLSTPIANNVSGSYEPFWLSLSGVTQSVIYYSLSEQGIDVYDNITKEYSVSEKLSSNCVLSMYVKKGNQISPIVHYTYTISEALLDQPKASKDSGDYEPFIFSFTNINDGEAVRYSIGTVGKAEYSEIVSVYVGSMLIKESCVISAYKYNNGKISKIATVSYTIKNNGNQDDIVVSKTTGSCNPFDLTIMTGIVGGTIYYTVGSEAKTGYDQIVTQYTNSIPITLTSVVSVYVKNGDQYTNIKSFTYTIYERTLSTPVANNISGSYEPFWLSLNTISGGEILYAVSDKEVTSYDSIGSTYSNQLRIDATQVVSAYVKSGSVISPIIHYSYIISETKLLTPNVSCKSGRYEPFIFSFTELLDGEEVRYDISKVGKSEYIDIRSVYTEPLLIKESCVISAFKKKGSLISDIERYTYTILNTGNSGDIVASKVTGPYNPFDLILKTGIVGGEIYYTVGSEAKTEYRQIVTQYTNPIAITSTSVVSVYVKNGAQYTNIQTFRYTIYEKTLPTPTANVVSGEYEPFWLSLNTIFGGEILYVVSDREVKSYDSILTKYSIPLRIDATQVVSAYVKSGDIISPIVHYTYTIRDVLLDQPSVSKITGDYAPFIFSFTNIDEGDEVRYSIGKTAKSEYFDILSVYKNSLLIKESCVISAYKYNNGKISKIMTVSYIIRNEDGQSDIIMSDGTGSYNPFDLSIATGIVDGEIYYAVGSEAKTVYSQILTRYTIPIPLSSTSVVSVYVKKGDQYTNIQSFTYTIYERTLPTPVANKLSGEYSPFIFNFLSTGNIKYIQSDTPVTSYNRIINTFEKPFIIDKTKYIACYSINENDGIISPIVNYQFTITNTKIPSPVPSKVEGDYFPFLLTLNKSNYYTIKYAISETVINDYSMILNEYVDAINIVKTGYLNCYKIENDLISDILSVKYTISNDLPVIPAIIKPVGSGVDNVISDNTLFSEGISWSDTINGRMLDYVIDMDLNNDSITDISINNGTLNSLSINDELKSKLSVNLTTLKIKVSIKDRSGGLLVDGVYKTYKYFNKKILKSNVSVEILKASRAGNDLFISSLTKVDNKVKGNFIVCDGLYNTKFDQTLQTNISGSIMSLSTSWGVSAGMTAFHVLDSGVNKIYYISNISSTSAGVINQTYINGRNPHVLYYNGNYHLFFINSNNNITEWTLNEMGVKQSEKEVVVNLSLYSTLNSVTQSDTHVAMGVEYFDSGLIKGKTYLFPIDLSTNTQFIDVFSLEQYGYSSNIDASYVSSVWNDDVNNYSFYYKLRALTGSDKKITIDTGEGSSAILGRANDVFYIMYDKMYSGYSEIFITKTDGSMKISEKITDDRKIRNNLNMVSYEKELYGVWLENGIDIAVIRIY